MFAVRNAIDGEIDRYINESNFVSLFVYRLVSRPLSLSLFLYASLFVLFVRGPTR
jgi:hypothetical protein